MSGQPAARTSTPVPDQLAGDAASPAHARSLTRERTGQAPCLEVVFPETAGPLTGADPPARELLSLTPRWRRR